MYFEIPGSNVRMLGSMHMVPAGTVAAPPWTEGAYDWCEALVHEHSKDDAAWMVRADRPLSAVVAFQLAMSSCAVAGRESTE